MTIALGILTHDSIVIAADTEVGVDSYLKTGQGKISYAQQVSSKHGRVAAIAITGSGNTAYLTHLRREFTGLLHAGKTPPSAEELGRYAADYVEQFYAKHILPFSSYGDQRPDTQIILAYCDKQKATIWSTENNLLTEHPGYVAVGAGEMYARILLNQLFLPMFPLTIKSATLLAAYVVFHVKEHIPGCGKDTDIVRLQGAQAHFLSREEVKEIETLFQACSRIETGLLHHVFGDSEKSNLPSISREVRKLRAEANRLLLSDQAD